MNRFCIRLTRYARFRITRDYELSFLRLGRLSSDSSTVIYCFSGASVSLSEAVKRQLRPWQNVDRLVCLFRCCKPPRARAKVAGAELVVDLRRLRSDVVKCCSRTYRNLPIGKALQPSPAYPFLRRGASGKSADQ